jgi:hypothetical protein
VQNNEPDRIADLLEEAATMLRQQQAEIGVLKVALQIMGINADSILRKAQEK